MSTTLPAKSTPRPSRTPRDAPWWKQWLVQPLASLRLTVILMSLSVVLVFIGTIAQVDDSIHTVLNKYFYTWIAWVPFQALYRFGEKFLYLSKDNTIPGGFPFPGGWLLGMFLLLNLLAAHATRFKRTWKRTGIWMIHIGVVLLLVGEFLSSQLKIESRMSIDEGKSSNYAEYDTEAELAFTDTSGSKEDHVVLVPQNRLKSGARISDPALPVDIEVLIYMSNSEFLEQPPKDNLATVGIGLEKGAEKLKEFSGVNPNQPVETASAYIRLLDKADGRDLGTYFVSRWLGYPQAVDVGDKTYGVALRGRRRYLPFSLHLTDFRFDRFVGTGTARNYSADVRLLDAERGEDRMFRISMNAPLRYRGETFYQSSFDRTETSTVLQVVRNPVWTTPYWATFLVAAGMLVHFSIHMSGFVSRRAKR